MAIRNIRTGNDPCLRVVCRPVDKFDDRLGQLLDDMYETMKQANGVGLAAPQVGIRRRAIVIDVGEGRVELINPEFLLQEGEQSVSKAAFLFQTAGCDTPPKPCESSCTAPRRNFL